MPWVFKNWILGWLLFESGRLIKARFCEFQLKTNSCLIYYNALVFYAKIFFSSVESSFQKWNFSWNCFYLTLSSELATLYKTFSFFRFQRFFKFITAQYQTEQQIGKSSILTFIFILLKLFFLRWWFLKPQYFCIFIQAHWVESERKEIGRKIKRQVSSL